jgi:SNF2 family DNA or RNA helicase
VRVDTAGMGQLALRVHTRQEWLALDGELKVDEELVLNLQQLVALQAQHVASRFMPLGDGRYVALTQELKERLAEMARVAEQRSAGKDTLAALRVPTVAAPWLQQVVQGAQFTMDEAMARQLARLEEAQAWVPALPSTLQARLRPYQEEGYEWAMRLSYAGLGACLADDMGLGKTLQALAVLLARAAKGPALIVAPTSLVGNWRAEALRFAPSLDVHIYGEPGADREAQRALDGPGQVLIVSYALLQPEAEAFQAKSWSTLILDEAQAIKNAAAKRSQAVFGLKADFRLALSGTPIENRLAELWSVMRACNPGLLGSLSRFNERFAGPIERQRDKAAQRQLRRLIGPFILRRTKAQVLDDLPPRTELVLKVHSEAAEKAHYEALRRDALVAAERSLSGDAPGQAQLNILAGLTRLRRAACDPRLASPHLHLIGAKVQAFGELATELVANGHKTLVFSQFVDFLQLLKAPLDEAGIAYQYLDGSTPAAERMKRVDAFQAGQGDLFLISLKAGGFGLNLTVADFVVIADPWWNPAAEDQASGRAHRIGQQRPVTVYRLVNEGTLEEKILTLHRDKRELADLLLEDDGNERKVLPRADELMALMRGDSDDGSDENLAELK